MKCLVIAGERSLALDARKVVDYLTTKNVDAITFASNKSLRQSLYYERQMYIFSKGYDVAIILLKPDDVYTEGIVRLQVKSKYQYMDLDRAIDRVVGMHKGWIKLWPQTSS